MSFKSSACALALGSLLATGPAWAQTPPDAGQLLQQNRPPPRLPAAAPTISVPPADLEPLPAGGARVVLQTLRISGNTVFSDAQLQAVLGPVRGQSYDMAGLQALAQRITEHYRAREYPFARAYIAAQQFVDGTLHITVLEGRYGRLSAVGDARLAPAAQRFLASLEPGALIGSAGLERATLLLSDQPGVQIRPVVRPGEAVGTGDLVIDVQPTPRWRGELGVDNHGNRYTGAHRASVGLSADSPLMLGDQFTLKAQYSEADQWLGQVGYSLPIGASGLRGQLGHAHTDYTLGKQFSSLQATGTADISTVGLSYPWLRSRQSNVSLSVLPQYKRLKDAQGATQSSNRKRSRLLPIGLQADHRDSLGGGGISYGSLVVAGGRLTLDPAQRANDAASARTEGSFSKLNLDLARHQSTPLAGLTLYGRIAGQWARKNLDSSEDFGLGGPAGVRAYPSGEGFGDAGWLGQLEARYALGALAPYVFHDRGRVKTNQRPWAAGDNRRALAGSGVGLRYLGEALTADASVAWRQSGGPATSDSRDRNPRLWLQAGWRF